MKSAIDSVGIKVSLSLSCRSKLAEVDSFCLVGHFEYFARIFLIFFDYFLDFP